MKDLSVWLKRFFGRKISRAGFLKVLFSGVTFVLSSSIFSKIAYAKAQTSAGRRSKGIKGEHDLVVVEGKDPFKNTVEAVDKMGGMGHFVSKDDIVVIKPNMAWDRVPEQAANTEPAVVAALVDMCYKVGAKRVNIFEVTCNDERMAYANSGIAEAAKEKGANVYYPNHWNVVKAHFSYDSPMEKWPILRDAVECDTFINVPVLKHHRLTGLTLSMKNMMGICSGARGLIHLDIGRKLVDITEFIAPDLTVIDATRVLMKNGPSGGDVADVKSFDRVIVSADPTLADFFAADLVGKDPMSVPYIKKAVKKGFGKHDLASADIVKITS